MPQTTHSDHDQPLSQFLQASSSQPMNMVTINSSLPTPTSSTPAESQQLSSESEKERKKEEKQRKKEEKKKKKKNCSSASSVKQSNIVAVAAAVACQHESSIVEANKRGWQYRLIRVSLKLLRLVKMQTKLLRLGSPTHSSA
ncbi:hypothetical protein QQP08_026787 [Theobroma cacao]|nr:hypothetical protein QQP08_026787 [Theobroma cacao]